VNLSHLEIQELIQRALSEPLTPDELIEVNNHLAVCPDCAVYRFELAILEDRLPRALAAEYPKRYLSRAQIAQVVHRHRTRTQRSQAWNRFFSLAQQAAFATAGVALVAALAILAAAQFGPRWPAPQIQVEPPGVAFSPENAPLPAGAEPAALPVGAYNSDQFAIQIQVPPDWQLVQQDAGGEVFSGSDGFVKLATLPIQATSIEQACSQEASSQPDLYGAAPQINRVVVDDMQACLIVGSADAEYQVSENEPAVLVNALVVEDTRRDPEERFWVMSADSENFEMLASSLQILEEEQVVVAAAEPSPEPQATAIPIPPSLTVSAVEVDPDGWVKLSGGRRGLTDTECIKSELYIRDSVPEWWPRDNCAQMLSDGKWEILVQLNALSPTVRIDPEQQNRFKVYWPGSPDISDWAYYPPAWAGLTLEEHAVVGAEVDSPLINGFEFKERIPAEIFEKHAALRDSTQQQEIEEYNRVLNSFGYRIEPGQRVHRLFKDSELLAQEILQFSPLSVNAAGTDFAIGFVDSRGSYLLQNNGVVEWDAVRHFSTWPVYAGNDLIAVEQGENGWNSLNVVRNGEVIFSKENVVVASTPVRALQSYNGQWVLETNDTVIMDGSDLRELTAYSEIFHWQILNGKPFYFFINEGKAGLSYGGQILPVQYEQVIHGQCCEPAIFNPSGNSRIVWFYALRNGIWHYVELGELY
jgi:hypothetical protein